MKCSSSKIGCLLLLFTGLIANMSAATNSSEYLLYVGVYGKGIYAYRFNATDAKLEPLGLAGELTNPSFLASDPEQRYLYAVSEVEGDHNGAVGAFKIDHHSGKLTPLNQASSEGVAPCHLAVDHSGKLLAAANYGTGNVPVFAIGQDGSLGKQVALLSAEGSGLDPKRQAGPHAHETVISADNRFLYVPDLGLDKIRIYNLNAEKGQVTPATPAFAKEQPGSGPRHIAFSKDGKFAYVISELKSAITSYTVNTDTGALNAFQSIPATADGHEADGGAEILIHPNGKFLYASVRFSGVIAVFAIDETSGQLRPVQSAAAGGAIPRGVQFDPTGNFLLVGDQKTNEFTLFRIDKATGQLTNTGQKLEVPSPVAFLFVQAR